MRLIDDQIPVVMDALRVIRRRRRRAHAPMLAILIMVAGALLVSALGWSLQGSPVARYVGLAVFLWFGYALLFEGVAGLVCPRCGRPFHWGRSYRNDFARRCMQCGLRLDGANVLDDYEIADPTMPDYRGTTNPARMLLFRRYRRYAIVALLGAFLVAFLWSSREWQLGTANGGCVVRLGQSRDEVAASCGSPEQQGDQPKVIGGASIFDWSVCSAPCDKHGDHILFYNCSTRVARAEPFQANDYQGCIFSQPGR